VVFISPELLAGCLPFAVSLYWPEPANFAAQQLAADNRWAIGIALIPIGFLGVIFSIWSSVLSQESVKKVLMPWSEFWRVRMRVYVAIGYCLLGSSFGLGGVFMVARGSLIWGASTTIAGVLLAASALSSVALAKWSLREILPD
jgi:hypothetical protein